MISAIMMPVHPDSGTPSVTKKDWKGEIKFGATKTTYRVPMVRIVPSMREAAGRGTRIPRVSKVSPDE